MRNLSRVLVIAFSVALFGTLAWGQTYVRPSKGKSFEPFVDGGVSDYTGTTSSTWTMYPSLPPDGGYASAQSAPFDWTAFSGLQLSLTIDYPNPGSLDYQQKITFSDLGSYVKFRAFYDPSIQKISVVVRESSSPNGPFIDVPEQPYLSVLTGSPANVYVTVTPIPFPTPGTVTSTTSSAPVDVRGTMPDCSLRGSSNWYGQGGAAYSDPGYALEFSATFFPQRTGSAQWPNASNPSNRATIRVCNAADNAFNFGYCFDAKTLDPDFSRLWLATGNFPTPPWDTASVQRILQNVSPITPGQCVEYYWNGRIFSDNQMNDVYCLGSPETKFTADVCLH